MDLNLSAKMIGKKDTKILQEFLDHFADFFMLCEGQEGDAKSLMTACPPSRNLATDKLLIGGYLDGKLIALLDLIRDHPTQGTWTIGYLLVHPDYRRLGIGRHFLDAIFEDIPFAKLRCVVQKQNAMALSFWENIGFIIQEKTQVKLGELESTTYVLEKSL